MYLKSVRAFGFKSFADKIDLTIKKGITAIVGPNGSGKSNIVDAVRWVLGEQSVKSLRGSEAMSDVIFSGSKSRDAQNRAYVALTFDNSDHYLNSEFNELEIKRVIYQTGENEYYINGSKVRLKDVTDLFLDIGAGNDSFNIISQGSVSDIINSKPEARRVIFEDAAGVLKYKKRKEISLKKLAKTKDNLDKLKLVIDELSKSVEPLKKQSEIAKSYLAKKDELKTIEIGVLAHDISSIHLDYEKNKLEVESLEKELTSLNTLNSEDSSILEKRKLENLKLEEEISEKNNQLIKLTENLASLEAEKLVTMERKKYDVSKEANEQILLDLKEEELSLKKDLLTKTAQVNEINRSIETKKAEKENKEDEILKNKVKRSQLMNQINDCAKDIMRYENKIDILEENISNLTKVPSSIKSLLNQVQIKGIHQTIGSLIKVEETYTLAIDLALGASSNFLVVENEDVSKKCISYLKENQLGRATFFPLNIIEAKSISKTDLDILKNMEGFVDIASHLVKRDSLYDKIIENQLGNVVVVDQIDHAYSCARALHFHYKIVTIDGEILYPGGSITGGFIKANTSFFHDKMELNEVKEKLTIKKVELDNFNKEYRNIETIMNDLESELDKITKEFVILNETYQTRKNLLDSIENELNKKELEIQDHNELGSSKLDEKLLNILEETNQVVSEKEILEQELTRLKKEKSDLSVTIHELENKFHKTNSEYNRISSSLKEKEIELGKYDVKLDHLLLELSENYNMTYEYASSHFDLELPLEQAKEKVGKLKKEIQDLGEVNTGAISEYERVNERYTFLLSQSSDLELASQELTQIINEMDEIMVQKFKTTFDEISKEFNHVFKELFKGGKGTLKLTAPDDILNTGIDIIAEPPGKKLNSIGLLSGGEKTLTAIAVLFAILNVKPSPFCILDEVEAALDEANVDTFGSYLQKKKEKSQFILITHKKRTMEYADVLYGITMQESGVSKLVSVNLESV